VAWNEWVQVAQTYFLLQGKTNTSRNFFMYWRDNLFERLQNNAYHNQYDSIASTIQRKWAGQDYSNIDIPALLVCLVNNPHHHLHDPQVGNDDGIANATAIVAVDNERILRKLQEKVQEQEATIKELRETVERLQQQLGTKAHHCHDIQNVPQQRHTVSDQQSSGELPVSWQNSNSMHGQGTVDS
jgi:hypothetical protein